MTTPSPHIARKRLKRKEKILTMALQMVTESGLETLTMHKLAAALST